MVDSDRDVFDSRVIINKFDLLLSAACEALSCVAVAVVLHGTSCIMCSA